MTRVNLLKTNFTAGEISPLLFGRGDLRAYDNGAAQLRNVFIHPTGGVYRRPGLRYVATARGRGRLVSFEFNTEQTYLLAFSEQMLDVYQDGDLIASVATPWTELQLAQIAWTQSADTLLVTHPDTEPRRITRTGPVTWTVDIWPFSVSGDLKRHPYYKFAGPDVTVTPGAVTGVIMLTASANLFDLAHAGQNWRIAGKQVRVDSVTSGTLANVTVLEDLLSTDPTPDFEEPAFSLLRGWPVTVAFHQDRLVIGGSRDLPNRLWLSKAGDLFNFDLGEGLDDESIEFPILSDQVNAIRGVFSGRHLQVFTSGAEWMVTGDPLTPATVQVRRQTRIGSAVDRYVPPKNVDGATLFVGRTGRELREFLFADIEQAYQAADLALLARHFFERLVSQDYDPERRLLHVVLADGCLATLTAFRSEQVTAWSRQQTEGSFRDVAVVGTETYVAVEREHGLFIEAFDDALGVDSGETQSLTTTAETIAGLDRLEGQAVTIVADGTVRTDAVVDSGIVPIGVESLVITAGLSFTHVIESLPIAANFPRGPSQGASYRLVEVTFRLHETGALAVDLGDGVKPTPFRQVGGNMTFGAPTPNFSGDKRLRALGWRRAGIDRPWRIEQAAPVPCTVLSVTTEIKVTD